MGNPARGVSRTTAVILVILSSVLTSGCSEREVPPWDYTIEEELPVYPGAEPVVGARLREGQQLLRSRDPAASVIAWYRNAPRATGWGSVGETLLDGRQVLSVAVGRFPGRRGSITIWEEGGFTRIELYSWLLKP